MSALDRINNALRSWLVDSRWNIQVEANPNNNVNSCRNENRQVSRFTSQAGSLEFQNRYGRQGLQIGSGIFRTPVHNEGYSMNVTFIDRSPNQDQRDGRLGAGDKIQWYSQQFRLEQIGDNHYRLVSDPLPGKTNSLDYDQLEFRRNAAGQWEWIETCLCDFSSLAREFNQIESNYQGALEEAASHTR